MKSTIFVCSLLLMAFVYGAWRNTGNTGTPRITGNPRITGASPSHANDNAPTQAEKDLRLEILENVFGGHSSASASDGSDGITSSTGTTSSGATTSPTRTTTPTSPTHTTGNGQPVPRSEYQPCLDSFVVVMNAYGIQAGSPQPIKTFPSMTYPITTAESLQGSGLLTWIQNVVQTYDPEGKGANLDFQLRFGVYTATFVKDMNQDASLTGRITTFIVPAYRTTTAAATAKAKAKTRLKLTTTADPGTDGYELGGVEP
ncbi:MAG: hypothetical protein JST42_16565 [Bacteroidetes bacterium]|nr:hypothetical protein [Bacteroidota bacterium]